MRLLRLLKILSVMHRYGLHEIVVDAFKSPIVRAVFRLFGSRRIYALPRGERLRRAFEDLGPIFVKFGQLLSTRRDLLPIDVADQLALLQDRVPPFPSDQALALIEQSLGKSIDELFSEFNATPVASASIAQVHFATLREGLAAGRQVAVKVLRPGMAEIIGKDLSLMRVAATIIEKTSVDGRRLRPRDVVAEFDIYLNDELDLMREAANAAQLRRNFAPETPEGRLLRIPEMYWDYCSTQVLVMERMFGVPISHIQHLREIGVDLKQLSRQGVEIFFTQVFRDGFFHADMHPGNIYVGVDGPDFGRYIALDFGIVGTLSDTDKHYLAQNFIAFFRRDYKRVAQLHIESGWVPRETRVEALESAVRSVIEPFFDRPLKEISLGLVLMRLFQISRRFNVEVQPQLVLLQKTLLNIEGLGRQLDPDLDLWKTAKPFLEHWMSQQVGWKGLRSRLSWEATQWSTIFPSLPRLVYQALTQSSNRLDQELALLAKQQRRTNRTLAFTLGVLAAVILLAVFHWVRYWF